MDKGDTMKIKDRIKELRRVKASELLPNPKNWRTHPDAQSNALKGVLAEVGFADAVIARETPDGLMLLDGHLRTEVAMDMEIPVLIVDLNYEEADKVLVTLDPLASMAGRDEGLLTQLLSSVDSENDAVKELLRALHDNDITGLNDFPDFGTELHEDIANNIQLCICECGHEHHKATE